MDNEIIHGEIVGHHTWNKQTTRLYVWYPHRDVNWRYDPNIADYLDEMRGLRSEYKIGSAVYYWNPKDYGCVLSIARLSSSVWR